MYIVKPYESALSLFGYDGSVRVFKTMQAALKALGYSWIERNVGRHFREWDHNVYLQHTNSALYLQRRVFLDVAFVMRNDAGEVVTATDFVPLKKRNCAKAAGRFDRMLSNWNGRGTVPGIHKRAAGRYYFRNLKNSKNLLRGAECFVDEGEVGPRIARTPTYLPNSWDDRFAAAQSNHNWKQFRRQQWRAPRFT